MAGKKVSNKKDHNKTHITKHTKQRHGWKHGHDEGEHCIVKRAGNVCEAYDERKVYGSAYAACYVVRMGEKECERVASSVAKATTKFVHEKKEVASKEIAKRVTKELKKHNKHAAFMYETHKDLA